MIDWLIGRLIDCALAPQDVKVNGWSFECRIYAEDPLRGFLPSVGTLSSYRPPDTATCAAAAAAALAATDPTSSTAPVDGKVRVDDGVVEGGEVSVHYDPMLAKLITHGSSRESARLLMLQVRSVEQPSARVEQLACALPPSTSTF